LYFSCKNYHELAEERITKAVGYFTTNSTKLVLHFSDFSTIFYVIYKNKLIGFTIEVILLRGGPEKTRPFAMWPLAMAGGVGRPNSGDSGEGIGRERCGEEGELTHDRFAIFRMVEGLPAGSCSGAGGCRPRYPLFRRGCGLGKERDGSESYCRCEGRWRRALLCLRPAGTRSSPRQPLMALAVAQAVDGGA
jgi:hypothetical protein